MRQLIFLAIALFAISAAYASDCEEPPTCPAYEVLSKCGNCRKTCNVREVDPRCVCVKGCICDHGYLRNSQGVCVKESECDSPCDGDLGRVFDPCGNPCPRTCDNINDPDWKCDKPCAETGACRCIDGLVLNHHGECVKPEDCHSRHKCPENEGYSECRANECQDTCDSPRNRFTCNTCKAGCVCPQRWIRDSNNICIPPELCDESCDGDPNAFFNKCLDRCNNRKCSDLGDPPISCAASCSKVEGCGCKPGYYGLDGKCIPKRDCPSCSGDNEAFLCRKCDLTCDNLDRDCAVSEDCKDGCYCKLGYARNKDGQCVPLREIEQESCDGDPNAYWDQCDENGCSRQGKCYCKKGYTKNDEGKCVLPDHCPYKKKSCKPPPTCGNNEIYDPNPVSICDPIDQTCDMYFKGIQPNCIHGKFGPPTCKCLPGYVRNNKGECVIPQDCCDDPNSEFIAGPNTCPGGTCQQPNFIPCDNPWQPFGCQCKAGFVKISDCNPKCIPLCDCCKYH